MESNSYWARLIALFKSLHSQYATQSTAGFILGGGLGYANYFGHIPDVLIHSWIGVWLWVKTLFWAGSSSVVTSLGSKIVDHYWAKRQKKNPPSRKKKRAA